MLDQHLWTTFHLAQAVVPGMVSRGFGRVVGVSSPFAANPGPRGAAYAVAKAAEEVVLRSVAREVGGSGVTANVVIVRAIDTEARARDRALAQERGLDDARGARRHARLPRLAGGRRGQRGPGDARRPRLSDARCRTTPGRG